MNEGKKDRRDPIRAVKPRNFVAKNAGATTSGAGAHKDKKKALTQVRDVKHKKQEFDEHIESLYATTLSETQDVCRVCGCTPCNCTHIVSENFDAEYDDEAGMADNNLETLKRAVQGIDELISAGDNLPEWCQEKVAVATSMLVAVWDYMRSEEDRDQDQTSEAYGRYRDPDAEYDQRRQAELDAQVKTRKVYQVYDGSIRKYIGPQFDDPKDALAFRAKQPNGKDMQVMGINLRVEEGDIGKAIGGALGGAAGGALGSVAGPVGTLAGRAAGAYLGGKLGDKITGEDQGIDDIIAWKQAVKKAYPQYADKMRFKGIGSQISAELPGVDRSFGVFDLETGTGQVLDEGKIYFKKLAGALSEQLKKR